MNTSFAPAIRESLEQIKERYNYLKATEYISKIINSLPYLTAVLNHNRQVVFANEKLYEILRIDKPENPLGKRPGEILQCINASMKPGGCGTSPNCSVCGAVNSILESQKTSMPSTKECRITGKEEILFAYDFKVITTPFTWRDETYYMFSLIDISDEKRRKNLERIFFHDVMNKTGSLVGFIDLIKHESDINKIKEYIHYLEIINIDLNEEILSQRDLTYAENGDLKLDLKSHNSLNIINSCISQIRFHDVIKNKHVNLDSLSDSVDLITDYTLLKRILINMLKNALEAILPDEKVIIGCKKTDKIIKFWVHNPTFIKEVDQLNIFQRSFSTKSLNRGLGTYSMKLLGENYLKGKVGFNSSMEKGTEFYILFLHKQ